MYGKLAFLAAIGLILYVCQSQPAGYFYFGATSIALYSHRLAPASKGDIPPFGLGTWLSERGKVSHAVEYALGTGYSHIDAALIYKNEDEVGKGIASSGVDRDDIWITSKLWNTDHDPDVARSSIRKSISDLGVEYLDLYLIHWPVAWKPGTKERNPDVTLVDTWKVMEEFVHQNLTRYIGVSNFAPADIEAILSVCEVCPYAHEFETHPYLQQQDWVDWHTERDIKVIAYSPLANTNPVYHPDLGAIFDDPFWKDLAEKKNAIVPQTVLGWGIQRGTTVIPKSVHEKYIDDNFGALDVEFTEEELAEVLRQDKGYRLSNPGKDWGVDLFKGLDDPSKRDDDDAEL